MSTRLAAGRCEREQTSARADPLARMGPNVSPDGSCEGIRRMPPASSSSSELGRRRRKTNQLETFEKLDFSARINQRAKRAGRAKCPTAAARRSPEPNRA